MSKASANKQFDEWCKRLSKGVNQEKSYEKKFAAASSTSEGTEGTEASCDQDGKGRGKSQADYSKAIGNSVNQHRTVKNISDILRSIYEIHTKLVGAHRKI